MSVRTHLRIDERNGYPVHVWACRYCEGMKPVPLHIEDVRCEECQDTQEEWDEECWCHDCEVMAANAEAGRLSDG